MRHGIFTFAEGAREAYELMIETVTLAEERLKRGKKTLVQANLPERLASVADIAPVLRELPGVDELFVCGTTTDVQAIVELDGKPIGTGKPGPITVRLRQALERRLYPD